MTDHQKAVCYDTLKDMEKAMGFTNTIVQPTITAEIIDGKPGYRG